MKDDFTAEQKLYLEGLMSGLQVARARATSPASALSAGAVLPEQAHYDAQARFVAAGNKLVPEELAKRRNPLDMWDELRAHAREDRLPKGPDIFRFKFHGLFNVAPAQDSLMCRLRIPAGILNSHQLRAVADIADGCGGGYAHVTTRANLQIREIAPRHATDVLTALQAAGLTSRGAGADNIRNVTGDPTAGIDVQELIDVRPLCEEMHYYILNHRELYGLPRKFNIAFDGGGTVSALAETNDIGFAAVKVERVDGLPDGVYFRMELGGITGHRDFARDTGVLLRPDECVPVAAAVLRVFIEQGDRTDRAKARLKYVLDRLGSQEFLAQTQARLGYTLNRLERERCVPRAPARRHAHVGVHAQRQAGLHYLGVVLPAGRLTTKQMRGLASVAQRHGSGTLRLTVWQNLLISDIPDGSVPLVEAEIAALGLASRATSVRAGLIACTGNTGCKFSAADTKRHAAAIAEYVEPRVTLDQPVNIHVTGCHHSCAQHYIGDIGLIAARIDAGGDVEIEGYHVHVGGGYGDGRRLAQELYRDVPATAVPVLIALMLTAYRERRASEAETFQAFCTRHTAEALREMFDAREALAA